MTVSWHRVDELPPQLRQRWAAARVWAAHQAPYLATAVLALQPLVVRTDAGAGPDLRGFPVDQAWHVYLDPDVLAAAEPQQIGFWLLHQVTHLLRRHGDRFPCGGTAAGGAPLESRTPEQRRWNLAGDAEINDDLRAGELTLPEEAVSPARLGLPDGWTAEQYWDVLPDGPADAGPSGSRASRGDDPRYPPRKARLTPGRPAAVLAGGTTPRYPPRKARLTPGRPASRYPPLTAAAAAMASPGPGTAAARDSARSASACSAATWPTASASTRSAAATCRPAGSGGRTTS